jgi:hypothetical protein
VDVFVKQPRDVLDYDVDMASWFAGSPGDDIQSVAITITGVSEPVPTLEFGQAPHPAYTLIGVTPVRFKLWLSGGTDYEDYIVTCVVTTEQDRTKEVEFKVKVRNK